MTSDSMAPLLTRQLNSYGSTRTRESYRSLERLTDIHRTCAKIVTLMPALLALVGMEATSPRRVSLGVVIRVRYLAVLLRVTVRGWLLAGRRLLPPAKPLPWTPASGRRKTLRIRLVIRNCTATFRPGPDRPRGGVPGVDRRGTTAAISKGPSPVIRSGKSQTTTQPASHKVHDRTAPGTHYDQSQRNRRTGCGSLAAEPLTQRRTLLLRRPKNLFPALRYTATPRANPEIPST
jgi:hypothetical protein